MFRNIIRISNKIIECKRNIKFVGSTKNFARSLNVLNFSRLEINSVNSHIRNFKLYSVEINKSNTMDQSKKLNQQKNDSIESKETTTNTNTTTSTTKKKVKSLEELLKQTGEKENEKIVANDGELYHNPETGEVGGPQYEPTKFGDWSKKGRVSDF